MKKLINNENEYDDLFNEFDKLMILKDHYHEMEKFRMIQEERIKQNFKARSKEDHYFVQHTQRTIYEDQYGNKKIIEDEKKIKSNNKSFIKKIMNLIK